MLRQLPRSKGHIIEDFTPATEQPTRHRNTATHPTRYEQNPIIKNMGYEANSEGGVKDAR